MIYDWLQNIKFIWPENFIFLAIIPFLIAQYVKNGKRARSAILTSGLQLKIPGTFKTRFRHLPFILRLIAIACLVTALARPQHQQDLSRSEGEGIDIMLVMDVSGSMLTQDIKPRRFTVAKEVAIDFVKNRPTDRIGLVIFSGEAFTKVPLTPDKATLLNQLNDLKVMDGGYLEPGTLIGEGLATAVNRISKGSSKTKVIILLTDGKEDAPPTRIIDPNMALEIAKSHNVRVYCIGLGVSEFTEEQMASGVRNFLDEDLLKKIAGQTGGQYYHAIDKSSLQAIYNQINKLEKTKVEVIRYKQTEEMFLPLALAALALLLLEMVLRYTVFKRFP
ncbi:vWA domain-containing protein [Niabella beijingensis]|uniref:vWA domain-containing protein n=1 Tax=Niabella beijingensis TaxID=2872700 RepID=UPI001CC1823D|nr:VWA domain-containing protein [Niabella beijingensis]MBZ4192301.1 VWA domain-containing protein [Niabella beijingensis]